MRHFFEFVSGFAMAMVVELMWRGMTWRGWLGTPPHMMLLFLGTTQQTRTHLVFAAWLVMGITGTVFLGARLIATAWWDVTVIGGGAVMWIAYAATFYPVRDIARAEAQKRLES